MQTKREREKLGANGCWSTCVVGHGRLVRVALLLEGHVPQLKHGRHHLQETCWTDRGAQSELIKPAPASTPMGTHRIKTKSLVPILSSSGMLMMLKASMVSANSSLSWRPGMVMFPLDRKRYLL